MSPFLIQYIRCYRNAWRLLCEASGCFGPEHRSFLFLAFAVVVLPVSPLIWFAVVAWKDAKGEL